MRPSGHKVVRVDLHTHSVASPDGGLTERDYRAMFASGKLDFIAVTDHDRIDFARSLQASLGDCIVVGEEIRAVEGEIIGLYLQEAVQPGLSAVETVAAIRWQNGLVYVPHPFETVRSGLTAAALESIADDVDILETRNGRAIFQNKTKKACQWAERHGWAEAASSDAHSPHGWGRTYSRVSAAPTRQTLVELLRTAGFRSGLPGIRGVLAPKFNRYSRRMKREQRHV